MAEWSGIVSTVTAKYLKGAVDNTIRNRKLLAMLNSKGRIKYNESGEHLEWNVKFAEPPVEAYADGGLVDYTRHDLWKRLSVDWRGYKSTDMFTKKEREMAKGSEALVKRYAEIVPNLYTAVENKLGLELYVDGYASGNQDRFCGINSFTGADVTASTGTDADDTIAKPSDTYAGKSTALGNEGGSWSSDLGAGSFPNDAVGTDWPEGTGDASYDYLTPRLINWSSSSWGTGVLTWAGNAERAIRKAIAWGETVGGPDGMLDAFFMTSSMYTDYLNTIAPAQRILVDQNSPMRKLGFDNVVMQDGVELTSEYGVPTNECYGLNFDQMELRCLTSKLIDSEGPTYDPRTFGYLFALMVFGNFKFNPKAFCKLKNYA